MRISDWSSDVCSSDLVVRYNDTCRSGWSISLDKHAAALGRIAQCMGQQVIEGFAQAATIARNFAQRRLDLNDQIDSLGLCLLPEFSYPSLYECGQFDWLLVQWQSACLSLRQIQDVLDQAGKPDSAFHDGADIFARLLGKFACITGLQHFSEARDGCQRSPQFIAHVGNESRLDLIRLLQRGIALAQRSEEHTSEIQSLMRIS